MKLIKIIYSLAVNVRNFLYDKKIFSSYQSSIPVISVGNITTGGTGKTPFVIFLANQLKNQGYEPLVISRGYKRQTKQQILITSKHSYKAKDVGDEPYLISYMCDGVDVLINKNRVDAVKWAEKQKKKYNLIILDDAFQHRAIARDFNILLMNTEQNVDSYPPQGDLREPFKNIKRADCVVLTKGSQEVKLTSLIKPFNLPIFKTKPTFQILNDNHDNKGVSFCGIACPDFFLQTLSELGIKSQQHISFDDHQVYDSNAINKIEKMLINNQKASFFTTRKDWVKLPEKLLHKYTGVCIDMEISMENSADKSQFEKLLHKYLKK